MQQLAPSIIKAIRKDYKSLTLNMEQIAEKYGINKQSVSNYCRDIEKSALKKEIAQIEEKINSNVIHEALEKAGINAEFVANQLKMLFSEDKKAAIQEYNKIKGHYSLDKSQIETNQALVDKYKIQLPRNDRDK